MSHHAISLRGLLEEAYRTTAWHGPNLKAALRGVSLRHAIWRPRPGRPCVWGLLLHCAFWKHRVRMRILGADEPFARAGAYFPHLPSQTDAKHWRADVRLLDREHAALLDVLDALPPRALDRRSRGHRQTPREMLVGIALHDTYHAGQIRALRKLAEARVPRAG